MGFKAAEAVKPLDYDFRPFVEAHGVIPEPSTGQVEDFFRALRSMASEVREIMGVAERLDEDDISEKDAAETIASMSDDLVSKFQGRLIDAVADLSQGTPSREEIAALPYRVLAAFNGWIGGELRPEQPRTATKPSRAVRAVR